VTFPERSDPRPAAASRRRAATLLGTLGAWAALAGAGPALVASAAPGAGPGASAPGAPLSDLIFTGAAATLKAPPPAPPAPVISSARCVPAAACPANPHHALRGGHLQLSGQLSAGEHVLFPKAGPRGRGIRGHVVQMLRGTGGGLLVHVPAAAVTGHIVVLSPSRVRSNAYGPIVFESRPRSKPRPLGGAALRSPFDGGGMWIWYLSASEGGSVQAIGARAHAQGITTVLLKSSDGGSNYWNQFSPGTVAALKAQGLHVCAWQYVYGSHPTAEADLGAQAVSAGADCLVIDAESEYEGRYAAAQTYMTRLRSKVGASFPVGLASFPYVDYHPAFPYSVFLGPGGAQYNLPQMYWKDIGTTVDAVFSHTWTYNRIYGRAIYPLGQSYSHPPNSDLARFRELATAYGARGLSWWDWQETTGGQWGSIGGPLGAPGGFQATNSEPVLAHNDSGDMVVWMQEHLASAVASTPTNGKFDGDTVNAVRQFQAQHNLPTDGQVGPSTWALLLAEPLTAVNWQQASSASVRAASLVVPGLGHAGGGPSGVVSPRGGFRHHRSELRHHHGRG